MGYTPMPSGHEQVLRNYIYELGLKQLFKQVAPGPKFLSFLDKLNKPSHAVSNNAVNTK